MLVSHEIDLKRLPDAFLQNSEGMHPKCLPLVCQSAPVGVSTTDLIEPEGDFYANLNVDRLAIFHGRIKLPFLDRLDGLRI